MSIKILINPPTIIEGTATKPDFGGLSQRIIDLLQAEIDKGNYEALPDPEPTSPQLNWDTAAPLAIASSVAEQIIQWAKYHNDIAVDFTRIMASLTAVREESLLQGQLKELKTDMGIKGPPLKFTAAQVTELDGFLEILGVSWRWSDL